MKLYIPQIFSKAEKNVMFNFQMVSVVLYEKIVVKIRIIYFTASRIKK